MKYRIDMCIDGTWTIGSPMEWPLSLCLESFEWLIANCTVDQVILVDENDQIIRRYLAVEVPGEAHER